MIGHNFKATSKAVQVRRCSKGRWLDPCPGIDCWPQGGEDWAIRRVPSGEAFHTSTLRTCLLVKCNGDFSTSWNMQLIHDFCVALKLLKCCKVCVISAPSCLALAVPLPESWRSSSWLWCSDVELGLSWLTWQCEVLRRLQVVQWEGWWPFLEGTSMCSVDKGLGGQQGHDLLQIIFGRWSAGQFPHAQEIQSY